jgi:signal transduction histidine kinase/DNA-binding response OmpR family regulator
MPSIGRTLQLALLGICLLLAAIAALGVGGLYDARQDYEDRLASAYELEAAAARMLAAGVIEEAALQARGSRAARRRAAATFDAEARVARGFALGDAQSERLVEARIGAQQDARAAAGRRRRDLDAPDPLASALIEAREASAELAERQRERRAEARKLATSDTRGALLTVAISGGLAVFAVAVLIGTLVARMRRPLDDLLGATRRLSTGELERRVQPAGPRELRDLGDAFNTMAGELHAAQDRIEEERRKLAVTVESLGDALVTCDEHGVVTSVNPRAAELVPELPPGAHVDAEDSPLPPAGEALAEEMLVEHGGRTLAVTAAPLGAPGEGTVWTIRDISERARLERLKSEFVATASHELRSPLTSIKGFAELLSRSEALDARQREFVDVIVLSTNRLVDLVNDLLEVARAEAGKIELHRRPVDVGEQVREIATLMQPRLDEKDQHIDLQIPQGLPRAFADPARVRQILTNLVTNAHLYTDEGGRLAVAVQADDAWLAVEVTDTGRGMTQDELEHAFDRFYRGDDGGGARPAGTGLGLSIVKSLVDLHEGQIEIDSEPGQGTTVRVRLPREPVAGADGAARVAIRGKRVLVVDDEPDITELIRAQLEPYGVETTVVHDGERALERLNGGGYDAVTLDLFMPGMSGFAVLRAIRADAALRGTPVVVVSVLSGREALAGEWTVNKPIDPEQLADALGSAVLAGRTRVLVVGRAALRERLEPALERIGVAHEWVTSATAAQRACREHRFEVALVDAGMRGPQAALAAIDLRGRRLGRRVVLFSAGDEAAGTASLSPEPVPLEEAAGAVLDALAGHDDR